MNGYDAIVVGARCAGSPAAMLLARRGHRVLLVDRATFPSDTISTLLVNPGGAPPCGDGGCSTRWSPPRLPGHHPVVFRRRPRCHLRYAATPRRVASAYAPRRSVLDKILVDAAAGAGAEVREGFSLDEVVIEDGTVVGISGHGADGTPVQARARVVVGADGWNSTVARAGPVLDERLDRVGGRGSGGARGSHGPVRARRRALRR